MPPVNRANKRRIRKPQSEWVRVENTQEPIISEQVFRQVQEQIANRRRKCKDGTTQIFSGLVKCADCGWSLSYGENRQNSKPYRGKFSSTVSGRTLIRVLLLQIGHSTHFSFSNMQPPYYQNKSNRQRPCHCKAAAYLCCSALRLCVWLCDN